MASAPPLVEHSTSASNDPNLVYYLLIEPGFISCLKQRNQLPNIVRPSRTLFRAADSSCTYRRQFTMSINDIAALNKGQHHETPVLHSELVRGPQELVNSTPWIVTAISLITMA